MPKAYSYIRFSSLKQQSGDSVRRQTDLAQVYASKHKLDLDTSTYRDLGISGYDRTNMKRGALAAFLSAVETGAVSKGSYLLIETFDRLSRAALNVAVKLLLDLTSAGIVVVTLMDEKEWTSDFVNEMPNFMYSIMLMSRAYEESATKSKRLRAAWGKKKAEASTKKLTAECPQWLKLKADRSDFNVYEDRADSIRKVYKLRASGLGSSAIVRQANQGGWPVPGLSGKWHGSLVGRLLQNRALLGEYQPHETREGKRVPVGDPIKDYYPTIISQAEWAAAHAVDQRHMDMPRRRSYRNILQGLLRCSCGASFVRKNKTSVSQPGYARYYCADRMRGVSLCSSLSVDEVEITLINNISMLSPLAVSINDQMKPLQDKIDGLELALVALGVRRQRLVQAIDESDSPLQVLVPQLDKVQLELDATERGLSESRNAFLDIKNFDSDDAFEDMYSVIKSGTDEERSSLRENLLRLLEYVEIFPDDGYMLLFTKIPDLAPLVVPVRESAIYPGYVPS